MFARTTRNYLVAALVVLSFVVSIQVFRIAAEVNPDSAWSAASEWTVWSWPPFGNSDADKSQPGGPQKPAAGAAPAEPPKQVQHDDNQDQDEPPRPHVKPQQSHKLDFDPFESTFDVPDVPFSDPKGPKPSQIALLTAGNGKGHGNKVAETLQQALENRKQYSDHHGYTFNFVNMSKYDMHGEHAVWGKIPAIIETFQQYPEVDWIWWLDLDAIIMTPTQDLTSLLLSEDGMKQVYRPERPYYLSPPVWTKSPYASAKELDFKNVDFIIAQDQNGLNAGSFFIRRSLFSAFLLDIWRDSLMVEKGFMAREQDALVHLVLEHPIVRKHVALVRQNSINAYVNGEGEMIWREGDLTVHLAGCWVKNLCDERWTEYWAKRKTLP